MSLQRLSSRNNRDSALLKLSRNMMAISSTDRPSTYLYVNISLYLGSITAKTLVIFSFKSTLSNASSGWIEEKRGSQVEATERKQYV